MIKNLIFYFYNNINFISNFYNYFLQLNIKFSYFKIIFFNNIKHLKIIIFNDINYKINQFLKLSKKCFNIKKIYSINNIKINLLIKIYFNKKIKFYKNFCFIIKKKFFIIFFNSKKKNYLFSILNNFFIYKLNYNY